MQQDNRNIMLPMKTPTKILATATGAILLATAAHAQLTAEEFVLGGYNFPTTGAGGFVPNSVHEDVSMNSIAKHANLVTFYMPTATFSDGTHQLTTSVASGAISSASARDNNSYFHFTVTPTNGPITFSRLFLDGMRGGGASPRGFAVASSADNYATFLGSADFTTQHPTLSTYEVDLSSLTNVTDPTTFRVYVYSPASTNTHYYDNLILTAIPEPSTYALGAGLLALGAAAFWRRRRAA